MYNVIQVTPRKRLLIVWFNPNKLSYYYSYVSGFYQDYYVGFKNQYNHSIIMIFELVHNSTRQPLKKRLIRRLISYLEKVERR